MGTENLFWQVFLFLQADSEALSSKKFEHLVCFVIYLYIEEMKGVFLFFYFVQSILTCNCCRSL